MPTTPPTRRRSVQFGIGTMLTVTTATIIVVALVSYGIKEHGKRFPVDRKARREANISRRIEYKTWTERWERDDPDLLEE
jgi:hypothetical protein